MTTIKATVKGGRLEIDVPPDWPDGTEVQIQPLSERPLVDRPSNSDEIMSPAEIARTLAAMEQIVPFDMAAEEQAAWEAERQAQREREKAHFAEHAEELRRMWE